MDTSKEALKKAEQSEADFLLGKSDAELMKEALTVAVDEKREDDERVQALDDFEMVRIHISLLANHFL